MCENKSTTQRGAGSSGNSVVCHEREFWKVLLRERKRHTARRVASVPSVVLTGVGGVYSRGVPSLDRGPCLTRGYLRWGPTWPGGVSKVGAPPSRGRGYLRRKPCLARWVPNAGFNYYRCY